MSRFQFPFMACFALILVSCDAPPSQGESVEPFTNNEAGFEAVITGSYEGNASGAGVIKFVPGAGFDKQGYFFLSDGQGIRDHGVPCSVVWIVCLKAPLIR